MFLKLSGLKEFSVMNEGGGKKCSNLFQKAIGLPSYRGDMTQLSNPLQLYKCSLCTNVPTIYNGHLLWQNISSHGN